MSSLSDNEIRAGRVVIAGFDGPTLSSDLQHLLAADALLGIILFKRNVESVEQTAALNESARRYARRGRPPVVGVDQEGGRVVRLREPLTVLPSARQLASFDNPELTRKAGRLVGEELSAVGFTLNFAPVLDVDTHSDSPVIGDRAYGSTTASVIRHGIAFGRGLQEGGVVPCAKHFPGHGDAALDSHLELPTVSCDLSRLEAVELPPFEAWIQAGVQPAPIMTAHVRYPALDPDLPATLSPKILDGVLRNRLGFTGPIFTDDMEMGAMASFGGPGGAAVQAVRAGADVVLVCRKMDHVNAVIESLAREAERDPLFSARLDEAVKRADSLRRTPGRDLSYFGSAAHDASARDVRDALSGVSS